MPPLHRFGRLDVVVNNAGLMTFHPLGVLTQEDWRRVMDVDLLGAFYFIKHGFAVMKPGSAVVNVASIHAIQTSSAGRSLRGCEGGAAVADPQRSH